MTTKHVAATYSKAKVSEDYYPIMDFLAQSPLDNALVHEPILLPAVVSEGWTSVQVEECKITVCLGSHSYDTTSKVLNVVLHFPSKKPYDAQASDEEIKEMLRSLNYTSSVADLGKLERRFLQKEWSLYFDQIVKAFTVKCCGFDASTSITFQIGYSMLTYKVIDVDSLLLQQMGQKIKHVEIGRTKIYYHRFIMMLLHHLVSELTTQLVDYIVKECYRS